jgi:hypothetical protein
MQQPGVVAQSLLSCAETSDRVEQDRVLQAHWIRTRGLGAGRTPV